MAWKYINDIHKSNFLPWIGSLAPNLKMLTLLEVQAFEDDKSSIREWLWIAEKYEENIVLI